MALFLNGSPSDLIPGDKPAKRSRGENFTEADRLLLVDVMGDNNILSLTECKKTDGVTSKIKKEAWQVVANKFNACTTSQKRSVEALQRLWKNLKDKAKREVTSHRRATFQTGGGKPAEPMTDLSNRVAGEYALLYIVYF